MPYKKVVLPNAKLESIFSCIKQPVFVTGPNLKIIYANQHMFNLVGKTKLTRTHCYELFHEDKKQPKTCPWRIDACNLQAEKECKCTKNKTENICRIDAVSIKDTNGEVIAALHMVEVRTEVAKLTEELVDTNKELQLLNEISSILSRSLDLDEVLTTALKRLIEWPDYDSAAIFLARNNFIEIKAHHGLGADFIKEMKVLPFGRGLSGIAASERKVITSEDAQLDIRTKTNIIAAEGLHATVAVPLIAKDKVLGVMTLGTKKIRLHSEKEIKLLESVADQIAVVIENAGLHQQTIVLSRTDDLTGLYNSRFFEEILQKQISWSKRKSKPFALMMLDLDDLKTVNDLYGHDSGDLLLKKFAQLLRENLRDSDFFARYGGDEFVILLPESNQQMAQRVAEKLIKAIQQASVFGIEKKPLMTASIGVAIFPRSASTMISLIKAADIAMYQAKHSGKNKICIFDPSLLPKVNFNQEHIQRIAHNADINSIQSLITAVDLKDKFTGCHSSEVSRLSVHLADRIGLSKFEKENLRVAALLHDIGKIAISDNILLKPNKLTLSEFGQVKRHPEFGVSILQHSKNFRAILPVVLHHHERWDGKGYPHGLSKNSIPLLARIVAIADAYEAMTASRPYRRAMSSKKALSQLWKFSERQFDPELVKNFTGLIKDLNKRQESSDFIKKQL